MTQDGLFAPRTAGNQRSDPLTITAAATEEKLGWVREAAGEGFASLKWVTSFPGNSWHGLPVVTGALLLSDAGTGELRAIADCASITPASISP